MKAIITKIRTSKKDENGNFILENNYHIENDDGSNVTLSQYCKDNNIDYFKIRRYLKKGMTIEEALTPKINMSKICKEKGISQVNILNRVKKKGMTTEEALNKEVRKYVHRNVDKNSLKDYGIKYETLMSRIQKGYSMEEALNIPVRYRSKESLKKISKIYNINHSTLCSRIYNQGMTIEEALLKSNIKRSIENE
jgi:hypothetical protein